ncbi:MAG: hypothetical protein Q7R49_03330 [Candidatus Daviesbacteria bacterium]|nr:hypothetical protein [Candidatus Daviesbacteria bacterium]
MVKTVSDELNRELNKVERFCFKLISWIGTPLSVIIHTILFIGIFGLQYVGFDTRTVLLILTTLISIEAIYLSIFIQMTVIRSGKHIESVKEDVEDIQEDVEDLESDVEEITEDIDVIQTEHIEEEEDKHQSATKSLGQIESQLQKVIAQLESLKKQNVL